MKIFQAISLFCIFLLISCSGPTKGIAKEKSKHLPKIASKNIVNTNDFLLFIKNLKKCVYSKNRINCQINYFQLDSRNRMSIDEEGINHTRTKKVCKFNKDEYSSTKKEFIECFNKSTHGVFELKKCIETVENNPSKYSKKNSIGTQADGKMAFCIFRKINNKWGLTELMPNETSNDPAH